MRPLRVCITRRAGCEGGRNLSGFSRTCGFSFLPEDEEDALRQGGLLGVVVRVRARERMVRVEGAPRGRRKWGIDIGGVGPVSSSV